MVKIIIFAKRIQICLEAMGIDENQEKLNQRVMINSQVCVLPNVKIYFQNVFL